MTLHMQPPVPPDHHSHDEAQAVADAAVTELLDSAKRGHTPRKCATGMTIAGMAAKAAVSERALDMVHAGTTMKESGANQHTTQPQTRANRHIHATDPHEYGFRRPRLTISADGLSYDMTAVEDALDAEMHGSHTENETAGEWFIDTVHRCNRNHPRGSARLAAHHRPHERGRRVHRPRRQLGSHEEAARLSEQRRFR